MTERMAMRMLQLFDADKWNCRDIQEQDWDSRQCEGGKHPARLATVADEDMGGAARVYHVVVHGVRALVGVDVSCGTQ